MSIFAFGVKNVLFCLHLFHEISPFYHLFIPIFSILFIVNLVTWVRENVYCPFKRLPLVVYLASPFIFQSSVADLPLTLAFSPLFSRNYFVAFAARRDVWIFLCEIQPHFWPFTFRYFFVKRLMASSVCACLLFTVIRLLLWKHQWAWATQDKV